MPAPSLLPAPRPATDIEPRLTELAEQRMLAPARAAGYELQLVGATVLPQRQTITRTEWGTWLFVDHVDDPTAAQYKGKIPIPECELAKLTALHRAGVSPGFVWIGHDLPETWREGDAIPDLVPAPAHLREKDERLTLRLAKATELFLRAAATTLFVAAAAPLAPLVAGGHDPIILGGVKHPEADVVQWALLAQWVWE